MADRTRHPKPGTVASAPASRPLCRRRSGSPPTQRRPEGSSAAASSPPPRPRPCRPARRPRQDSLPAQGRWMENPLAAPRIPCPRPGRGSVRKRHAEERQPGMPANPGTGPCGRNSSARGWESRRATRAAMDIRVRNVYFWGMIARLVAMLAILAIAVVTTAAPAHAARMGMGSGMDRAMHVGDAMRSADSAGLACDAGQPCGSADAGMCGFACTALSAILTSPGGPAGQVHGPVSHGLPADATHASRVPGLNERPPQPRLL